MSRKPVTRVILPHHQQAMALKFQGKNYTQIAKAIGISGGTVRNWFMTNGQCADAYREYCERIMNPSVPTTHTDSRNVAEQIKAAAPAALASIVDLSQNARREAVKFAASADILDRAGYAPVQKMLNVHAVEEMPLDQLDALVGTLLGKAETKYATPDVAELDVLYREGTPGTPGTPDVPAHTHTDAPVTPAVPGTGDDASTIHVPSLDNVAELSDVAPGDSDGTPGVHRAVRGV